MQVKFFQPPVTNIPRLRTDVEPRKMDRGGATSGGYEEFRFGDFFGSNPGAGTGYYKKPETQFVDAAEEVTTEQPQTAQEVRATIPPKPKRSDSKYQFGPWSGKKGMETFKRDLYNWEERYGMFPTTEGAAEWLYGDQDPYYETTEGSTSTQTQTETQTEDTGPTTRELILQAEQWFLDNNVGLPYSRQDYASDEEYLNALNGFIDTYVAPEEVVETTTDAGTTDTTTTTTGGTTDTTTTDGTRIEQLLDPEQLREMGYLTQEEIAAMGYMTPEQMAEQGYMSRAEFDEYLAQQSPGLTADQVQNIIDQQDYDTTFNELTTRLDDLNQKYADSQSQYDADAAKAQIDQTKSDLQSFFSSAQPSGPRTGATSQFSKQPSFISGSANPMANLIKSQRESTGQDPYDYYYSSFTPSYSDFDEPMSAKEYGQRSGPVAFDYPNPFTQGAASGGSVSNFQQPQQPSFLKHGGGIEQPSVDQGIGAALNFQTNVDPFQSAFRPNVKRR